jgi:hypothetical protein
MIPVSLQITYRKGRPFAAYILGSRIVVRPRCIRLRAHPTPIADSSWDTEARLVALLPLIHHLQDPDRLYTQ